MSVRRVIEPLMDPRLRQLCTPRRGEDFDARSFVAAQGSLYLVAGQHQAAQAAPLLTALVEYWLTTAQEIALNYPNRRVDPPVTTVLDELTNATRYRNCPTSCPTPPAAGYSSTGPRNRWPNSKTSTPHHEPANYWTTPPR
jgi:hypothetical protein